MSRKGTDLQKVISEIKASLKDKEFENLKDTVLTKVNNTENVTDLLKDRSIQATLQTLLQNQNLASLLNNTDLNEQLAKLLANPNANNLIEQLKAALNSTDAEKKK